MSDKTRILILEPSVDGHRGPYLHWMMTGLADRGFDVTLVTWPESLAHPSIRELANQATGDGKKNIQIISSREGTWLRNPKPSLAGLMARQLALWKLYKSWYRIHAGNSNIDVVFLPSLDACFYAIAILGSPFGSTPWTGIFMRASFHYREMGVVAPESALAPLKRLLFFRVLKNKHLRCLLTIDEPLVRYLSGITEKIVFLPEPAEFDSLPDVAEARQKLGLPKMRKLVLVYGSISLRKGLAELLRALMHPDFPSSTDILLAGKIGSDASALLASPEICQHVSAGRVKLLDRFITQEEETFLFAAVDIVWLGYRGHYAPSGVLVQAANANRPVIACIEGIIGWQTRRRSLGEETQIDDPSAVVKAINSLLDGWEKSNVTAAREPMPLGVSLMKAQDCLARAVSGDLTFCMPCD